MAYLLRYMKELAFGDEQMMAAIRDMEVEKMKHDPGP